MGAKSLYSSIVWLMPFFSDLTERERQELLKVASFKHVKSGETVFLQGTRLTQLYWICSGHVQLYRVTPDGHELTSKIGIVGDVLFDPDISHLKHTHASNARAVMETTLFTLPAEWIEKNMRSFDRLTEKFFTLLIEQTREAQMDAEQRSTMSAAQSVACFLQRLCVLHNFDPRGFDLPYTKSLIASRLGIELETFSRTLHKLKQHGIVVEGNHVAFRNPEAATRFVCDSCSASGECTVHQAFRQDTGHRATSGNA